MKQPSWKDEDLTVNKYLFQCKQLRKKHASDFKMHISELHSRPMKSNILGWNWKILHLSFVNDSHYLKV